MNSKSLIVTFSLSPEKAVSEGEIERVARKVSGITEESQVKIVKKSIDARRGNIIINYTAEVIPASYSEPERAPVYTGQDVSRKEEVIIVGSGPAGLFAALRLIELGLKPVILERGKEVSERKKDVAIISRDHLVNEDSNYCFGEGGAGTFSDGKLYTRSKKRGENARILELLVLHGAPPEILYEAHPHIGTDRLPSVIKKIRETIQEHGGEIHFNSRVSELVLKGSVLSGVKTNDGRTFTSKKIILATGHSARDIYKLLSSAEVKLEFKPFAMGVRVEHPQELINRIQYHNSKSIPFLPAATYSITRQVNGRGVYSFCMCPGGFIVPSATSATEVVVNGMSNYNRNSPFANSGIVVEVRQEDLPDSYLKEGAIGGMMWQEEIERRAWDRAGKTQMAPTQRLGDFVSGRLSANLPKVSYFPGVTSSALHEWLPQGISSKLRGAFMEWGGIMKGFLTNEAVVTGVESRTSSSVRIPRNPETNEHIELKGLYPCGEGAGYAGGIVSSAIDGWITASKIGGQDIS